MIARKILAVSAMFATTAALSGCSFGGINVIDPEGIGVCNGTEAVSLQVTQDAAGENMTIVYTGPSDVSIIAYQGLYSDTNFFDLYPAKSFAFGYPIDEFEGDTDLAFTALDIEADPWDVTFVSGDVVRAEYDGSVAQFVDDLAYNAEDEDVTNAAWDRLLPVTIGVMCESGFTSRLVDSPVLDSDQIYGDIELAVAQSFYPNFMYVDPPTATAQEDIENGVSGKISFPDELADALPDDFEPALMQASAFYVGDRDPTLPPNDEYPFTLDGVDLGDMFFISIFATLEFEANSTFEFTGDYSLTEPVDFDFTGDTAAPADGYYLFFLIVGDDTDDPQDFKIVTSILRYSDDRGLTFDEFTASPTNENLAPTGGDPNVIIWAVLGGLVVLAAVALRPKRRKAQTDSTIDPSARNE